MTYLEILGWARKGMAAESAKLREMLGASIDGQSKSLIQVLQSQIDEIEVKKATLDEIEEIHNRK